MSFLWKNKKTSLTKKKPEEDDNSIDTSLGEFIFGGQKSDSIISTKLLSIPGINTLIFPDDNGLIRYFNVNDFRKCQIVLRTHRTQIVNCEYRQLKKIVAMKIIPIPDSSNEERFINLQREIEVHKKISSHVHPNIILFYGQCIYNNHLLICMESMDFSLAEFYQHVHESNIIFPEDIFGAVVISLLNALNFCKSIDIIHRDVKPGNVLINRNGAIKLCDFGTAGVLYNSFASSCVGTLVYWPPEAFAHELLKYDIRRDVWSLGITILEIAYGRIPYNIEEPSKVLFTMMRLILHLNTEELITKCLGKPFEKYSEEFFQFIKLCLKPVDQRPSFDTLMETTFVRNYLDLSKKMVNMSRFIKMIAEKNPHYKFENSHSSTDKLKPSYIDKSLVNNNSSKEDVISEIEKLKKIQEIKRSEIEELKKIQEIERSEIEELKKIKSQLKKEIDGFKYMVFGGPSTSAPKEINAKNITTVDKEVQVDFRMSIEKVNTSTNKKIIGNHHNWLENELLKIIYEKITQLCNANDQFWTKVDARRIAVICHDDYNKLEMFINEAKKLALIESSYDDLNFVIKIEIFLHHFTQAWHNIVKLEEEEDLR